jgi:hypothetical protein
MHLPLLAFLSRATVVALFVLLSSAHAADTGTVSGQVSNAATRAFLEGAVVAVAGTSQSAVTDREGRFQLNVE